MIDQTIRSLFILGANAPTEDLNWLKRRYPNSQVVRFSTRGAIRETVNSFSKRGVVDSLCLIGTNDTVPTFNIYDEDETLRQEQSLGGRHLKPVESDLFFCADRFQIQGIPDYNDHIKSTAVANRVQRFTAEQIAGALPVGRIPFDESRLWQSYLDRIERNELGNDPEWLAITDSSDEWMWECETVLSSLSVSGNVIALPNEEIDELDGGMGLNHVPRGARLLINLHGSLPSDTEHQAFSDNYGNSYRLAEELKFPEASLFLFSCYGGNSRWWKTGAIKNFFEQGGALAIAASTAVWCTEPSETDSKAPPPGAVQLCYEFFNAVEIGIPIGEAFCIAKMNTIKSALDSGTDWLFCKSMKEIVQFSLYGAPWLTLNSSNSRDTDNQPRPAKAKTRLIDTIRQGIVDRQIQEKSTNRLIDSIREKLNQSLGKECEFFKATTEYVAQNLQNNEALTALQKELRTDNFELSDTKHESFLRNGNRYYWTTMLATGPQSQQHELSVLLNANGDVVKSFKLKAR